MDRREDAASQRKAMKSRKKLINSQTANYNTVTGLSRPAFANIFNQASEEDAFLAEQSTLPVSAFDNNQSRFVLQQVSRNRNAMSENVNNNNNSVRRREMSDGGGPTSPKRSDGVRRAESVRSGSQKSVTKLPRGMSTTVL